MNKTATTAPTDRLASLLDRARDEAECADREVARLATEIRTLAGLAIVGVAGSLHVVDFISDKATKYGVAIANRDARHAAVRSLEWASTGEVDV